MKKSKVKLNARQKVAVEKFKRKQNDAPGGAYYGTGVLGNIFGGGGPGGSPLSSPWQLAYDTNFDLISLNRVLLSYFYVNHGIIQTVIDQPIEDAFRGGLEFKSDELDAEDLELFSNYVDYFILPEAKTALKWEQLFGGSGLIINTAQDPTTELDIDAIGEDEPLAFIPADRWELTLNFLNEEKIECPYNYYGQAIHKSRVIKLKGKEAPSFVRRRLQGWGMSEVERLVRDAQMYTKNQDALWEFIDEAKIDVMQIEGYNQSILNGRAQELINKRMQDLMMGKNYHNAVILDKEDGYEQKQLTLSGLAEVFTQLRIGIAAAARMPVTKIFGLQAAGFNSGQDDIENYNSVIESQHRANARKIMLEVIPMAARQVFGYDPKIDFEFKALRTLGALDEETMKSSKFNRYHALYADGLYTPKEFLEKLRREGLEDMDTEVGKGSRDPEPPQPAFSVATPQEPLKPTKKSEE